MEPCSVSRVSDKNIALLQALRQAFARRDIPTMLSLLSPTVEWGEPPNPCNPAGGKVHYFNGEVMPAEQE